MKQFDQHSENIEREGAKAFLEFIESKIKPLAWTSDFINSIETDSQEFIRGDYDEQIKAELDAPNFAEISLSIRERQMLEAGAMFVERELDRLDKVGRPRDENPSKAALKMRKHRKNKIAP